MDSVFRVFLSMFGVLFAGVGGYFCAVAVRNVFLGYVSNKWISTVGSIVSSKVKIESNTIKSGDDAIVAASSYRYSADIVYKYTANNVERSGSKVLFAETNSRDLQSAQAVVNRHPAGSTTTVFYDPARPQRAVLEPGVKAGNFLVVVVGGLLALVGAAIVASGVYGFERAFGLIGSLAFFRIVTTGGVAAGTLTLIAGVSLARRARASRRWPMVKGTVVSSAILKEFSNPSDNAGGRRIASGYQYKPEVAFEYTVLGVKYLSNRVSFGDYSTNTTGHAARVTERYPEGAPVNVFYNPNNPRDAVLEHTAGFGVWLVFIAGFFLLAVSALFIYIGPERFKW